jgi:hypothetical protein
VKVRNRSLWALASAATCCHERNAISVALHLEEEALRVGLAGEGLRALLAEWVAVASPVAALAGSLLGEADRLTTSPRPPVSEK